MIPVDGPNQLRASIVIVGLIVGIGGCTNDPPTALDNTLETEGFRYEGLAQINSQGNTIVVVLIRNQTLEPKRITTTEGCNPVPQLFRSPARSGRPVWNGFALDEASCLTVPEEFFLLPNEEREFRSVLIPAEVKGDSLPSGTYYIAASLKVNQDTIKVAAGTISL